MLEPGIHEGVPFEEYLDLNYINSSSLKCAVEESMLKMKASVDGELEDSDSTSRRFGRGEHCGILEGMDVLAQRFLIADSCCELVKSGPNAGMPCGNNGTSMDSAGNWFCGIHSKCRELETPTDFITKDELARIQRVAESIRRHPCMKMLKRPGWSELTIVWDMFGLRFKGRLDRASLGGKRPFIIDLKKHDQSSLLPEICDSIICKYKYYIQAALYCMGVETLTGKRPYFMWLFTQSKPPFDVLPRMMNLATFEHGKLWIEAVCERYKACQDSGVFPGVWPYERPGMSQLTEREQRFTPDKLFLSDEDAVNSVASVR